MLIMSARADERSDEIPTGVVSGFRCTSDRDATKKHDGKRPGQFPLRPVLALPIRGWTGRDAGIIIRATVRRTGTAFTVPI